MSVPNFMDMNPGFLYSLEIKNIILTVLEVLASDFFFFFAIGMMSIWNIQKKTIKDTFEEKVLGT